MTLLLERLEGARRDGRKILVPYLMGGIPDAPAFPSTLLAVAEHADALEVGLPYSDPLMDGPVIAAAGERALRAGVGPSEVISAVGAVDVQVPHMFMTYYNPVHRMGEREFCRRAAEARCSGLIVPDIPLEESDGLRRAAGDAGLAWVPLVAPTSPASRVARIAETATGFVYAVSTLGVTGTRDELAAGAAAVVEACRRSTDLPVLVGIGVSSAEHARAAAEHADGVVIGSAVVRLVLEEGAAAAGDWLAGVREALNTAGSPA